MKKIEGSPKTLKQLLLNTKYSIHYYQREYMWQDKHIEELIDDLTDEFLNWYKDGDDRIDVDNYGAYFMGSVVLAGRENAIIDGQQRLSSLTLLLIYLNNRLKKAGLTHRSIEGMIFSESHGQESFNIFVDDRKECMQALFEDREFDTSNSNESVKNLYGRYEYIVRNFNSEIADNILLHFCDWIIDKVFFIEIVASTEQDAHKVFVSMNDRGLSLTSTEMLKGYILSEITNDDTREEMNNLWKQLVQKLKSDDDSKSDEVFIKNWLRAQYAETIREAKVKATNRDFDIIGGPFHKWVRDEKEKLGLNKSEDFVQFVKKFEKFVEVYLIIKDAENKFNEELKYVYYNAQLNFTLQQQLLLAPICFEDSIDIIKQKIILVSRFIDLLIVARVVNYKSVEYSTIKNFIFNVTKTIRNSSVEDLKIKLLRIISEYQYQPEDKAFDELELNFFTKKYIKHMLARITGYIEEQSDIKSNYCDYINIKSKNPYEVEHIITDHYEWYADEYIDQLDFRHWRNKLGNLLLLHKSINASINDNKFTDKRGTYCSNEGNIYSESLCEQAYINNPRFVKFIKSNKLNFKAYENFGKNEIEERTKLFVQLFRLIWNDEMFR